MMKLIKKLHQQVQTMKNKTYLQVFFLLQFLKKISFLLVFVESTQQTLPFNLSVALISQKAVSLMPDWQTMMTHLLPN